MSIKKTSVFSAVLASTCCVPPLILLGLSLIGVGTAGVAGLSGTLGSLKWYLLPVALIGLGTSYVLYFREKSRCKATSCKMAGKMFTTATLITSSIFVMGFTGWSVYPYVTGKSHIVTIEQNDLTHFAVFDVEGMTCGACELAVNGSIKATGQVDSVKSSFTEGKTIVWYSGDDIDLAKVLTAIRSVGYNAKLEENKKRTTNNH